MYPFVNKACFFNFLRFPFRGNNGVAFRGNSGVAHTFRGNNRAIVGLRTFRGDNRAILGLRTLFGVITGFLFAHKNTL